MPPGPHANRYTKGPSGVSPLSLGGTVEDQRKFHRVPTGTVTPKALRRFRRFLDPKDPGPLFILTGGRRDVTR